jgi:ribosomal protein L37E
MSRYAYGGKTTVESCQSIDVLHWNRLGYFRYSPWFSWVRTRDGERLASVEIRHHSVILKYRSRPYGEDWSDVEQWVIIAWTPCRFGGERPWFVCSAESNGVDCGRRVTKLYSVGGLFACRHCHRLAYESQHESTRHRGLGKARKIRMQLGGSANMFKEFPDKPKHMHWRTYDRLRRAHNIAEERTMNRLMRFVRLHSHVDRAAMSRACPMRS